MNLVILSNIESKITQTIQSNFSDIDPNSTDLITINYINRPRKYQIEGTNLWVYDGNSDYGPASPSEFQMVTFGTVVFQLQHQLNYSSLSKSTREFEINYLAKAYQNIYANGYVCMIVQLVL